MLYEVITEFTPNDQSPAVGIVTKNSILLVEYALVEIEKGVSRGAAIVDACSKRARPILV